jgi:glycosyltransferase involved in cell wall biosynthesis
MKISFVVPFHNEEKNCRSMVERIISFGKRRKLNFEIIAVDDRSSDDTGKILKSLSRIHPLLKPLFRKGDTEEKGNTMGKALREGSKKSSGQIVIWTMGDLSDDPKSYADIIRKVQEGYDMVFGSRYMPGGSRGNLDKFKAFLSSWGTRLARFLFGIPVHDITNAFRGFRRTLIENIILESSGFSISPEFAIKAHLAGLRLGEVPTVYTNRVEGISNFKLYRMAKMYLELYWHLFYRYKILRLPYDFLRKD